MYKITKINTDFQYKQIPEGIDPNFIRQKTYEEIERLNCQNENNVYFQEALPKDADGDVLNPLYWKVFDNIVVAMTEEECISLDEELYLKELNSKYSFDLYTLDSAPTTKLYVPLRYDGTSFGKVLAGYTFVGTYTQSGNQVEKTTTEIATQANNYSAHDLIGDKLNNLKLLE